MEADRYFLRIFPRWILLEELPFLMRGGSCGVETGYSTRKRMFQTALLTTIVSGHIVLELRHAFDDDRGVFVGNNGPCEAWERPINIRRAIVERLMSVLPS